MSVMRGGRVFEKVGVNVSTVYGTLGARAQAAMAARKGLPGMTDDPRFWASGISLVAHMQNPHCPAVHMNTRMFWTPHGWWFGGGSDLNPCLEYDEDTAHFHAVQKTHCDRHGTEHYPRLKAWADEYFYIPHRGRARGVGGIFLDDHNSGDWEADFAFIKDIGQAFCPPSRRLLKSGGWMPLARPRRMRSLCTVVSMPSIISSMIGARNSALRPGHDANAVLMSLPPMAKWV